MPAAGDRIYFAETPAQVIALLRLTIGIHPDRVQEETDYLALAAQAGRCQELRFRGWFGHVGELAYVSMGQIRPRPLFKIGSKVRFFNQAPDYTVSGICLVQPVRGVAGEPYGATVWHYFYAEARNQALAMSEKNTAAA